MLHGYDGAPRDARAAVLIRIAAVIYVEWELPDEFRGKEGHDRQERKSLIDDGRRSFPMGSAALTSALRRQNADGSASR